MVRCRVTYKPDPNAITLPVVSSWGSKHHIMIVLGKSGCQALLAEAEMVVVFVSAHTEVPAASVRVGERVEGQVLTEDVTAPRSGVRLPVTLLITMGTCLK